MSVECDICGKEVRSIPSLNMHMAMAHKDRAKAKPILVPGKAEPARIIRNNADVREDEEADPEPEGRDKFDEEDEEHQESERDIWTETWELFGRG
jgi:hypothetical protein